MTNREPRPHAMTSGRWKPEHEAHLQRLLAWVATQVDRKYRRGQAEHGGKLWEKPGLWCRRSSRAHLEPLSSASKACYALVPASIPGSE